MQIMAVKRRVRKRLPCDRAKTTELKLTPSPVMAMDPTMMPEEAQMAPMPMVLSAPSLTALINLCRPMRVLLRNQETMTMAAMEYRPARDMEDPTIMSI
jgi:hypothetical protein